MLIYGERIKQCMKENGETQTELAEGIGASLVSINRWIKGWTEPDAKWIRKIARHYGVTTDYLLAMDLDE